jgi:threonine dehydratase
MAQAVAWYARAEGIPCAVVVPETAPQTKLDAIGRLGAELITVSFPAWLEVFRERRFPGLDGVFIHPFSDTAVMSGNGTIALEIVEDLPDVDAVLVPYGGGGLLCGIASVLRALRPACPVYACEVATAAPLAASLAAGEPVEVSHEPTFVDGIGAPRVFPEMFALARDLTAGSLVVSVEDVARAVALLAARARVVAEGAGAAPVAAAIASPTLVGTVACVVSGGNIDASKLETILGGGIP